MKKLTLLLVLTLLGVVLIACKPTPEPDPNGGDNGNGNGGGNQTIALTYADWDTSGINQKLIDAFMVEYPHIRVTLRTDIQGHGETFTGNLINAAQMGMLPDVYAIDNVPTIVNAGLAYDVAEFWNADEDAALVYPYIAQAGVYNDKRYAIPSFQFLKGVFMNLDIFERANLTTVPGRYRIDINTGYPVKDWTFEEFVEIAKAIKNFPAAPEDIIIGLDTWYGAPDFNVIWPTMENEDTLYDTWDGESFHFTSSEWIYAMQQKVALHVLENGTTPFFFDETRDNFDQTILDVIDQYVIQTGHGAMDIEGSWQFWLMTEGERVGTNYGFWPYPQGSEGYFPPVVLDFQIVSSQTEHPEEAYLLAKWMTFGKQGWNARLDALETERAEAIAAGDATVYLDRFPVADYPEIWERVYGLTDGIEGIEYTFEHIAKAKPDLDKWLAGYKEFYAWVYDEENPWGWEALIQAGPNSVPQFAAQWEARANEIVGNAISSLGRENEE